MECESVNTPVQAYFWLTSCPAMVWGCRQAFLQMTSALTKEMTLTGEWQTDRQLLRQGCCRQQHWGAGAELSLVNCLLIITLFMTIQSLHVQIDGELKSWVEILHLLYLLMFHTASYVPYCYFSHALFCNVQTVYWTIFCNSCHKK